MRKIRKNARTAAAARPSQQKAVTSESRAAAGGDRITAQKLRLSSSRCNFVLSKTSHNGQRATLHSSTHTHEFVALSLFFFFEKKKQGYICTYKIFKKQLSTCLSL